MRSVEEQLVHILGQLAPMPGLEVQLQEAQGCLLAQEVVAPLDLPPWDNSAMDGYAVRIADVTGASPEFPAELDVIDDIAAGAVSHRVVKPGTCARIMTGAPVPEGTEAIVAVEQTDRGTRRVKIETESSEGQFIRLRGSDVSTGQLLLPAGTELGSAQIGMLAAIGVSRVEVHPRPRVVVISTGSELVEPGQPLGPGQIYESNSYMLAAAAREAGAVAYRIGMVHDDEELVLSTIEEQTSRADLIVTSGGVSAGAYDVVKGVLSRLGTVEFGGIKMNPGKPQGFGFIGGEAFGSGVPIFTLPGNPVSSYVSFEVFVRPAIRRLRGLAPERRAITQATISTDLSSPGGKTQFARGWVVPSGAYGLPEVRPVGGAGSHLLAGLATSNCFIVIGEDVTEVKAGEQVDIMRFGAAS
ncbi:gephyrin-like molybdotransferase Glp [Sporichthya sp.]|uniref:molybdotransferase-like divisome protein Glp n=1 Tax=Sporichthya sp. TaxID=65475 RepID=UPI0017FC1818|nr:gephyrin-like molybdotransferase Glp [Sporichthya sp.]MBA3743382.1 molybdopterin molybdotransferase MoeA [Sporichthya sp.]